MPLHTLPPRALTIDAWWAWAIAYGPKRVENRSWRTTYRGPLYIHAGLTTKRDEEARSAIHEIDPLQLANWAEAKQVVDTLRGKIIAVCDLVDCVPSDRVPADQPAWAFGPWCWVLDNVQRLDTPLPAVGKQGLWVPTL